MCKTYLAKPVCRACIQPESPYIAGEAVYAVCPIATNQRRLCKSIVASPAEYVVGNTRCDPCLRAGRPFAGNSSQAALKKPRPLISPKVDPEVLAGVRRRFLPIRDVDSHDYYPDASSNTFSLPPAFYSGVPRSGFVGEYRAGDYTRCLPKSAPFGKGARGFQDHHEVVPILATKPELDTDTSDSDIDIVGIARRRNSSIKPFHLNDPDKVPVWFYKNEISGTPAEAEAFRLQQLLFQSDFMPEVPVANRAVAACRVACDRNGINLPYRSLINEVGIDIEMPELRRICQRITSLISENNWDEKLRKARNQHGGWGMASDFRKLSVEVARRFSEPMRKRSSQWSGVQKKTRHSR